eukprot:CAMPEP_0204595224 /NCGR_PEP_ID=MMETSP0661-20131031/52539_1 /ASSEMBLY_ACC=CAM_ASM_000606 /TAXON_ID=109239 /ORGANISM="Alexandrium margalefi, Strain AMGDE01CS-322" /LENGTH=419 /DNA_ID=CAMNT_0051605715 /DNA_START=85 /DNA_END=1344 /DNA_ORIENTATION=+
MASGLAGKVRRSTESDEFELTNYDQARCDELAKNAFSEPFPLNEMVKLSFVVGGGKLVRQKFSDDLPKLFMSSLSAVGFQDDSTAALEAKSAGKFKFQHDTGKNLKFVHVFPRICAPQAAGAGGGEGEEEEDEDEKPSSPEDILLRSSLKDLTRLVADYVTTYGQKKKLLDFIKGRISSLEQIEAKMTRLEKLTAEEQALFDDVGADELREKVKFLTGELQRMVDEGQLTSAEKAAFLEQLEGKLEAVDAEIKKAEAEGKAKKVQALTQQREAAQKTRAAVKDAGAIGLPPLRHGSELKKLYGKLAELNRMEKASKGHYSMDELKRLGERPEIEEAVSVLETRSRGWFEDDEVFRERVQACMKAGASASAKKAAGGAPSQRPGSSGSIGGFQTVSGGARVNKAKAAGPSTRNAFGALDR